MALKNKLKQSPSYYIVLRESPETISIEELCEKEEKAQTSSRIKAKKGKAKKQQQKTKSGGGGVGETQKQTAGGAKEVKDKGKGMEKPTGAITTTLIPNGNELLVQLKAETNWLWEKSKQQPKKTNKKKTPDEEEVVEEEASVWTAAGDKRYAISICL
jgi:hypothetical protein